MLYKNPKIQSMKTTLKTDWYLINKPVTLSSGSILKMELNLQLSRCKSNAIPRRRFGLTRLFPQLKKSKRRKKPLKPTKLQ